MASYDYDLIVIGSGAGGNIAAQHVAKAGKRVAVVEMNQFGGSQITGGRVPLSTLLHAASIYDAAANGTKLGIRGTTLSYNYPTLKAWKDSVVKRTGIQNTEASFSKLGINFILGRAYFIDPHTISIGPARYSAREFLIATGSSTVVPSIPGLSQSGYLTSKDALSLTRPPKKLAILGGGPVSSEFTQLFSVFGTTIHIVEKGPSLLPKEEPEASTLIESTFEKAHGITTHLESTIEKIETISAGKKILIRHGGKQHTLVVNEILVATEKRAVTDIGLENAGVQYEDNHIYTSSTMETSVPHIYAAGSCTGSQNSTHMSAYQSQVAANNILHPKKTIAIDYRATPRAIFTNPELASVGSTQLELDQNGTSYKVAVVPLSVIARSNISDFNNGFIKVLASKKTDVLLGATVVGPQASEIIHELAVAIQNYVTAANMARTMHIFPSWSEIVRVACMKLALK